MLLLIIPVACPAQSSGIIMVITEIGQIVQFVQIDAFAPLAVVIAQIVHVLLVEQGVSDPEEERIVENRIQCAHVSSHVAHPSIEDFSDCVYSCSLCELAPKPLRHLRYSINPYPIDMILVDEIAYPTEQGSADIVVLLLEIGQLGQSAVFNSILVVGGEILI